MLDLSPKRGPPSSEQAGQFRKLQQQLNPNALSTSADRRPLCRPIFGARQDLKLFPDPLLACRARVEYRRRRVQHLIAEGGEDGVFALINVIADRAGLDDLVDRLLEGGR